MGEEKVDDSGRKRETPLCSYSEWSESGPLREYFEKILESFKTYCS